MTYFGMLGRPDQAANVPSHISNEAAREKAITFEAICKRKHAMELAIEDFLNTLSEAERACGRVVHELVPLTIRDERLISSSNLYNELFERLRTRDDVGLEHDRVPDT